MKKSFGIITLLLLFTLSASQAFAGRFKTTGDMYIIPKAEVHFGVGNAHFAEAGNEDFTNNPGIGAGAIYGYGILDKLHAEVDGSFIYWISSTPSGFESTMFMVPIFLGAHYQFHKDWAGIAGIGLTYWYYSLEYNVPSTVNPATTSKIKNSNEELELSYYVGIEYKHKDFRFRGKMNYISAVAGDSSINFSAEVGYFINLGK